MSQLTDYREKYPRHTKGLSDDQILERLHKSFYNSQDFEKFKEDFTSDDPNIATTVDNDKEEEDKEEPIILDELIEKDEKSVLSEDLDSLQNIDPFAKVKAESGFIGGLDKILRFPSVARENITDTAMGALGDISQETLQLINGIADYTGIYDFDAELNEKQQKSMSKILQTLVGKDKVTTKERGQYDVATITEPDYRGGELVRDLTGIIGSIFVGTKGVGAITSASAKTQKGAQIVKQLEGREKTLKALKFAKFSAGADIGIQLSIDPYEARFANMIGENIRDDQVALATIVDFLEADPNDTEMEARAGLFFETFALNLALPVAWVGGKQVIQKAKDSETIMKTLKEIRGKGGDAVRDFKATLFKGSQDAGERAPQLKGKPEDVSHLWQYSPQEWKRFISRFAYDKLGIGAQELVRSRGYFTPKAFEIFRGAEAAKAAWFQRTQDLANNLNTKIDNIADKSSRYKNREQLADKVQQAFTSGSKKDLKALPVALRKDIAAIRQEVDKMSEMLLQMPNRTVSKEAKEAINKNMGQWFRRSYKLYEEGGWKPSEEIITNAEKYLYSYLRRNFKRYKKMSPVKLKGVVKQRITNLIEDAGPSGDIFERMNAVHGLNKSLLKRKGDLAKPLRELMGEIKDPSQNMLISLNRISSFVENNEFLEQTWKTGRGIINNKTGQVQKGYIFDDEYIDVVTGVKYNTQLKDPSLGILNGKFVTPETAAMLGQRQLFGDQLIKSNMYRYALAAKGYGQASKTVLNHITHLRNSLGGVFFTLANGRNPISKEGKESYKILRNKLRNQGDVKAQEYYQKLRRLDLVDNSARFGDIKALMKEQDIEGLLDKASLKLGWQKGFGKVKKATSKLQETYIAEDDFFKILNFEKELSTLRNAYKSELKNGTRTLASLEEEAATIVRNTIPNYSMVPTGIKELRKLPIGNYFSFPAEMVRTSFHIVRQAGDEIYRGVTTGNTVLRNRGLQRGAGFGAVGVFGAEGLSGLTKAIASVTDEEADSLRHLSPYTFQKNSTMLYYRDGEGNLFTNDFSYVDPYDTIKRPFVTLLHEFSDGKRTQKDFEDSLLDATSEAMHEFFKPFIEEALLTEAFWDTTIRRGRTKEGYLIPGWTEGDVGELSVDERLGNMLASFKHVYASLAPGGLAQVPKIYKAATGEERDWLNALMGAKPGSREYDLQAEILANMTGIRWTPVDLEKQLKQQASRYTSRVADVRTNFKRGAVGPSKTKEHFVAAYRDANEARYRHWKDLTLAYEASINLGLDPVLAERYLKDNGISEDEMSRIRLNSFTPFVPSNKNYLNFQSENRGNKSIISLKNTISEYHYIYDRLPIIDFDKEDYSYSVEMLEEAKEIDRESKVTGGLIEGEEEVPYAKEKPEERINPFTGEPYTALYNGESVRQQYAEGGSDDKKKVDEGLEEDVDKYIKDSEGNYIYSRATRNDNPFNLVHNPSIGRKDIPWEGKLSYDPSIEETFERFENPLMGMRAGIINTLTHYDRGNNTLRDLVSTHAPQKGEIIKDKDENPTENFISFVSDRMGIKDTDKLDMTDRKTLEQYVKAVIEFEVFDLKDKELIDRAIDLAYEYKKIKS